MAGAKIDTPFDDACYDRGSDSAEGSGVVTNSFPGLKEATEGQVDVVIMDYTNIKKATLDRYGRVLGGN